MNIEQLDLTSLKIFSEKEIVDSDGKVIKFYFYYDEHIIFKAWTSNIQQYVRGQSYYSYLNQSLLGFDVGFNNKDNSSAFIDTIYKGGELVGCLMKKGNHISSYFSEEGILLQDYQLFVKSLWDAAIRSGWIYSDICHNNIVLVEGRYSLIDFDGHFSCLSDMSYDFEVREGALRPHIDPYIRGCIFEFLRKKNEKI